MDKFFTLVVFVIAVFVLTRAAAEKMKAAMKAANPPAPPRRSRARAARATPPSLTAPHSSESEGPAPMAASEHPVVTHPARRVNAHPEFRGRAALRRAIVAREVLGPPLALRPPRF